MFTLSEVDILVFLCIINASEGMTNREGVEAYNGFIQFQYFGNKGMVQGQVGNPKTIHGRLLSRVHYLSQTGCWNKATC